MDVEMKEKGYVFYEENEIGPNFESEILYKKNNS